MEFRTVGKYIKNSLTYKLMILFTRTVSYIYFIKVRVIFFQFFIPTP